MNKSKNKSKATEKVVEKPKFKPYVVEIIADKTIIYGEASAESAFVDYVYKKRAYTIVAEDKGFGKLKSGAGWIFLEDTKLVRYV